MYIKRIQLHNIKCFGQSGNNVVLDLQRPDGKYAGWTVVAGLNGSGKSTFLHTIALAVAGPRLTRPLQESFKNWITFGQTSGFTSIDLVYDKNDKFSTHEKPDFGTLSLGIDWSYPVKTQTNTEPMIAGLYESSDRKETSLIDNGPWNDTLRGWFISGYGPFRRLPGHGIEPRSLKNGHSRIAQLAGLFKEDIPLTESIPWLKEIYLRRLEKRPGAKELEKSVLSFLDDGLLPAGMKIKKIDSDGLWVTTSNDQVLSLHDLSDGYRTVAALVLDIIRQLFDTYGEFKLKKRNGKYCADYPGVILIDEIDTHMHISWQQNIGSWLKQHFPGIQFIVTTHSPFICQSADAKGLIRLPAPGENGTAEHLSEELFNIVRNGTADEAVLTKLFGLKSPHSPDSEKIREEIAGLEVLLIQGKATPAQKKRYDALIEQLPKTQSSLVEQAMRALGNGA